MPSGQCRLCNSDADLQLSHIIPAFVFRWMKDTSGGSHIRHVRAPNLRIQDGEKRYWLCSGCENLFSRDEATFADQLFHPYSRRQSARFVYGEWLLRFCVSVSWRILHLHRELPEIKTFEPEAIAAVEAAEGMWKAFLLRREAHPGPYEQHLIPFEQIKSISFPTGQVSAHLNRYLMRTIDLDLFRGEKCICVYAKLGPIAILGFVREPDRSRWKNTKVHVRSGVIEPRIYTVPKALFDYVNRKADRTAESLSKISQHQSEKIDQSFRANIDKYVGSDEFLAMQNDVRMFGDTAFTRRQNSEDSDK